MQPRDHNIVEAGRVARMRIGALIYAVGLGYSIWVIEAGLPLALRVLAFLPFFAAGVMVFQAAYRTCLVRALRGERETELGVEPVHHAAQVAADRARGFAVLRSAFVVSVLGTAVLALLP